jgi:hypothetical protein
MAGMPGLTLPVNVQSLASAGLIEVQAELKNIEAIKMAVVQKMLRYIYSILSFRR